MGFGIEQMSSFKKKKTHSQKKGTTIWHKMLDDMDTVPREVSGLSYISISDYTHYLSTASKLFQSVPSVILVHCAILDVCTCMCVLG